jgi:transcriptional regulator with XRE-family HTH domain
MPKHQTINDALKAAIKASGLTFYAVAKLAECSPGQVSRFMSGERDLRLGTASAIAAALRLELRRF